MSLWRQLLYGMRSLANREKHRREIAEEVEQYFEQAAEAWSSRGLSPEEARRAALLEQGNMALAQERVISYGWENVAGNLFRDLRVAARRLRKQPAFTATAVLTLALGIGAVTAIFTLVNAVLLQSLPVKDPGQLWRVGDNEQCCFSNGLPGSYSTPNDWSLFSYEQYLEFRAGTPGLESLAAFEASAEPFAVRRFGSGQPVQPYSVELVSGNAFHTLGLRPYAGRLLQASDDRIGVPPVAVLSYQAWSENFGRDPAMVGTGLLINGRPVTVVGIAPPGFYGERLSPTPPSLWLPITATAQLSPLDNQLDHPETQWLNLIGRIEPGASVAGIQARMQVELQNFLRSPLSKVIGPERPLIPKQYLRLTPGGGGVRRMQQQYESDLRLLMWISAFVLLIVCANLANLMLARSVTQRAPNAVQTALGASLARLTQRALVECLLLAITGGLAGLLVAWGGVRLILHLALPEAPANINTGPSWSVLGFAFAASLLTGLLFGVAPSWLAAHANPIEALRGANRSTGHSTLWTQKVLVAAQVAVCVILLCSAGFLMVSLHRLQHRNLGFQTANRTILMIDPQDAGYRPDQLDTLYQQLHDTLGAIPGVSRVAWSLWSPLDGRNRSERIYVEGHPVPRPESQDDYASWNRVSPGYFDAIGTRLVEGRLILEQDDRTSRNVAVVNETFVRRVLHGKNPIGMHFGDADPSIRTIYEIVGVVEDTQYWGPGALIQPMYFVAAAQWPQLPASAPAAADYAQAIANTHYMWSIQLETNGALPDLEVQVRRALAEVNPNLMLVRYQSFSRQVSLAFSQQTMIAQLTSLFGALALLLAAIGIYGVTSYTVAQKTGEIAIRMALGANRGTVLRLVFRGASMQVGLGLLFGIPAAIASGRLMASQLFGVTVYSPLVLGTAIVTLMIAAFLAAALPARRAAGVEPMQALRGE